MQASGIQPVATRDLRPYHFGLARIQALRALQPELRFLREGSAMDALLGTRQVRTALERGDTAEVIAGRDKPTIQAFRQGRRSVLLYDQGAAEN